MPQWWNVAMRACFQYMWPVLSLFTYSCKLNVFKICCTCETFPSWSHVLLQESPRIMNLRKRFLVNTDLERSRDLQEQSLYGLSGKTRVTWGKPEVSYMNNSIFKHLGSVQAESFVFLLSLKCCLSYCRSVAYIVPCELEKLIWICFKFDVFLNNFHNCVLHLFWIPCQSFLKSKSL